MVTTRPVGNVEATKKPVVAGLKVLKRDGFAALGVSAVARQAKLGKPLIYRYFGGFTGPERLWRAHRSFGRRSDGG